MASSMNFFFALYEAGIMQFDYMRLSLAFPRISATCQFMLGRRCEQSRKPSSPSMILTDETLWTWASCFRAAVLLAAARSSNHQRRDKSDILSGRLAGAAEPLPGLPSQRRNRADGL